MKFLNKFLICCLLIVSTVVDMFRDVEYGLSTNNSQYGNNRHANKYLVNRENWSLF